MSRILHVVAAVILDRDSVFACRRNPERAVGGKWEFPGGKVEAGESLTVAVVRELCEELGVRIEVLGHLRTDDTSLGDLTIRLHALAARLTGPKPTKSLDHDRLAWIPITDLRLYDWAPADLPTVRHLQSRGPLALNLRNGHESVSVTDEDENFQ